MPIFSMLVVLILVGVGLYLVNTVIPMDGKIKTIINVVVVVFVLLWLVQVSGLAGSLGSVRIGR